MSPQTNINVHGGFYDYLHDELDKNNNSNSPICIIQNICQRIVNSYIEIEDDKEDDKEDDQEDNKKKNLKSFRIILTGHSLGGSTSLISAIIFAINLFLKNGILINKNNGNDNEIIKLYIDVYIYGAPNVGNNEFYLLTKLLESICDLSIYSIINNNDIVVRYPMISNVKNADYFPYFYENINLGKCANIQKGYKFDSNNFSLMIIPEMLTHHYSSTYFEKIFHNYQDVLKLMNEYQIIKENNKNKYFLFGYPSQEKFKFC